MSEDTKNTTPEVAGPEPCPPPDKSSEEKKVDASVMVRGKVLDLKSKYANPMIFKTRLAFVLVHHYTDMTFDITVVNALEPHRGWRSRPEDLEIVSLDLVYDGLSGTPGFASLVHWDSDGCSLSLECKGGIGFKTYKIPLAPLVPIESLSAHAAFTGELLVRLEGRVAAQRPSA